MLTYSYFNRIYELKHANLFYVIHLKLFEASISLILNAFNLFNIERTHIYTSTCTFFS